MHRIRTTYRLLVATLITLAAPVLVFAQQPPTAPSGINTSYLSGYRDSFLFIINGILTPVFVAIAFITFLWGVYTYFILGADSPDKRKEGGNFVLWSVIGFVVIFSVWGLVSLVGGLLGPAAGGVAPKPPQF